MNDTVAQVPQTIDPPARPSMADGPLPTYESHSSLSTYRECPLRYGYRYVERLPGEVRADGVSGPGPELLQATVDAELDASGLTRDEIAGARLRAAPVLARFLEMEAGRDAEPVAVELGFGVPVALPGDAGGVRFVGYLDRVDRAVSEHGTCREIATKSAEAISVSRA